MQNKLVDYKLILIASPVLITQNLGDVIRCGLIVALLVGLQVHTPTFQHVS
jgi:hypothetical protein